MENHSQDAFTYLVDWFLVVPRLLPLYWRKLMLAGWAAVSGWLWFGCGLVVVGWLVGWWLRAVWFWRILSVLCVVYP